MDHKQLNGKRGVVHYWTAGKGPQALFFTHGATMDHGLFEYQVAYFSKNYKVINWDVPLHGLSRPYEDFSLGNSAEDLVRILDAEGIPKAHLVGQSMGGYISQIAAFKYPERVSTLTAIGSSPVQLSYYSRMDRWLLSITPFLLRFYPYNYLIKTIAEQIAVDPSAKAYALATLKTYTKAEIADIMMAVYTGLLDYGEDIRLTCPVLVVYGKEDNTGKVRSYSIRWAEEERRELKVISIAAHNANMDNPEDFNEILEGFIQRAGKTSAAQA